MNYVIWLAQTLFAIVMQVVFLWLQFGMFRRYQHHSFMLLAIGSVLGIVYYLVALSMDFVPLDSVKIAMIGLVSTVLVTISTLLYLIGTISLFRSYAELAGIVKIQQKSNL